MRIAIISDSHDNIHRIDQMLEILKKEKISTMIHCGDVTTLNTLKYLSEKFSGKIYLSIGNVDEMYGLKKICILPTGRQVNFKNVIVFEKFGELQIENKKIAFVHFPKTAKELAETQKYDFVFYGHTHGPWEKNISKTIMANPGTLAGTFSKSTFAVLDLENKNLELIIL